ncbi:MAG TPA: hypothetical protein PKK10_09320 [Woeseiaceae bacterium]|nr:hypothetical protein [Woeseiaceae bacterium]
MSQHPTEEQIIAAIEKSGYLMEQRVATQLETLGFHVFTNVAFEDSDEGKSREIDIRAIRRVGHNERKKLSAFVELMVECKNSANPLVFIIRSKNAADEKRSPNHFRFPVRYQMQKDLGGGRARSREINPFFHLGFGDIHYESNLSSKAVQFCRIDRKGSGWAANHGGLYDAIFYPIAKALEARAKELPKGNRPDEWKHIWMLIPMFVTTSELFVLIPAHPPHLSSPEDTWHSVESSEQATFPARILSILFSKGI